MFVEYLKKYLKYTFIVKYNKLELKSKFYLDPVLMGIIINKFLMILIQDTNLVVQKLNKSLQILEIKSKLLKKSVGKTEM